MLAPRSLILDRFEIDAVAGSGGMGTVYRAWDRENGSLVAVKVMHEKSAADRFAREAELLRALDHPGIVRFVAHGALPDGAPVLVMEWLEGESLQQRLDREPLSVGEAVALGRTVARSLAAAHGAGIVHRDLKPGNLYLLGGSLERVKIVDFGIARLSGSQEELTATGAMLGTPGYMAPEQVQAARAVGPAADLYALGAVLFRALAGRPIYEGDNPLGVLLRVLMEQPPHLRSLRPDVPASLDALVARLLAKDPDARPEGAGAVAAELEAIAAGASGSGHADEGAPVEDKGRAVLLAQLKVGAAAADLTHSVADAAAEHGVSPSVLADGSLLFTAALPDALAEQVGRLARAALVLRGLHAGLGFVLAAESPDHGVSAGSFQRGVALMATTRPAQIRLDPLTATLLPSPFELHHGPDGASLLGAGAAPSVPAATIAATGRPGPRTRARRWPWAAGGVALLAAAAGGGVAIYTAGASARPEPSASLAESARSAPASSAVPPAQKPCPFERCVPFTVPDPEHTDVGALVPDVVKLAKSIEPTARLGLISLIESVGGYHDSRRLMNAASYAFSYQAPAGPRTLLVMIVEQQFVVHRNDVAFEVPEVGLPKCSAPVAFQAAVAAGLPASGKHSVVYSASRIKPGGSVWQFVSAGQTDMRFIDGETCGLIAF